MFRHFCLMVAAAAVVCPSQSNATEYWTVKAEGGVLAKANGQVAINIGSFQPISPNPPTSVWTSCPSNWIYFHQTVDGAAVDPDQLDRMLAIVMSAFKSGSRIRIALDRDTAGTCYTANVLDQGP